uniref:Cytochrome c biogenesis protein CcsA n=1 Tax=Sphagnum aongstroemii TaxID=128180 RepID=A0A172N6Y1_9BRYO|nr:protein involved in cytochrome c biogenesis [Sphagnum aongstroemii]
MIFIILERILAHTSFFLLFLITLIFWGKTIYTRNEKLDHFGKKGMVIAYSCVTGFLLNRWIYSGHLPLSNLYESSMFLSWSFSLIHIILEVRSPNFWLGTITAPSAMLTHAFATLGIPKEMQQSAVLVPALQSNWLMMHVSMMMLSYATLLLGSLLAIAFLCISFERNTDFPVYYYDTKLSILSFLRRDIYSSNREKKGSYLQKKICLLSIDYRRWRLTQQLDHWSYRIIGLGFPLLTIGILSGAVWANEAWGSYWSWDPKETWALITWLIFAIYLHTRMNRGWQGRKSAIVASLGFLIIWICYLGVNLLGRGLHSYGWLI